MHRTRVKICGLTREQDVQAAAALGADAVGFVCFPGSPRFVEPGLLADLSRIVPPFVTPVLLFVECARVTQILDVGVILDAGLKQRIEPKARLPGKGEGRSIGAG